MPVTWYLKVVSSVASSSILTFRKFIFLGGVLAFFSSFLHLPCLGLKGHLYLRFIPSSKPWCYLRWLYGEQIQEMAPPTHTMCNGNFKDQPALLNKQGSCPAKFGPLVVVFVGLPARGKTIRAYKLTHYLNWIGQAANVFVASDYRRKMMKQYDSHNLFRADNREAMEIRRKSSLAAVEDATEWLKTDGNIAVLDGTNVTRSQRENVHDHFSRRLGYKVMFVECICEDDAMLSRNMKEILANSPDYRDMAKEKAQDDLHHKIQHYQEYYEPINPKQEANLSFIKIINEGETLSAHHMKGHLESHILTYLSNFSPAPRTLYLSRHGESENNVLGRIGGDADLSPRGRMYGKSLSHHINELNIEGLRVWTSELCRTKQTAQGIKAFTEHLASLNELHAGVCEGLSYEEMQDKFPQEFAWRDQDKLRYRYPWGESYLDIMARLEPVLLELEHEHNVLILSHQAVLRCMLGYFLNKRPEDVPYMNVPLHTIIKLTTHGYNHHMELIKLPVDCVDTYRQQPKNCCPVHSTDDALLTVPPHLESLDLESLNVWQLTGHSDLIEH